MSSSETFDVEVNDLAKIDDELCVIANGIKVPFDKNNQKIKIDLNSISTCSVCNKQISINVIAKNIRKAIFIDNTVEDKLIEIEIMTVHKECKRLKDKFDKLRNQILDVEFEIFCLGE